MKRKKIILTVLILISINIRAFSQTNHLRNSVSLEFFNSIMTTVAAPLFVNNAMYFFLDNLKVDKFKYNFEEDINININIYNTNIKQTVKLQVPIEIDVRNEIIKPSIAKNIFYGKGAGKINYSFDISKKIVLSFDAGILLWNVKFDRNYPLTEEISQTNINLDGYIGGFSGNGEFNASFNYNADLYVIPIALGLRFYLNKNEYAHGFFIMPKFGATITILNENFLFGIYSGGTVNFTLPIGTDTFTNEVTLGESSGYKDIGSSIQFGFYASFELGWRIRLFPSKHTVWKVRPFIDFSLFEFGYYINSYMNEGWALGNLGKLFHTDLFDQWGFLFNFKILPIPRIAIGIMF